MTSQNQSEPINHKTASLYDCYRELIERTVLAIRRFTADVTSHEFADELAEPMPHWQFDGSLANMPRNVHIFVERCLRTPAGKLSSEDSRYVRERLLAYRPIPAPIRD